MTNKKRIELAKKALVAFNGKPLNKMNQEDLNDSITDLIVDLLHYAKSKDKWPTILIQTALMHYKEETK